MEYQPGDKVFYKGKVYLFQMEAGEYLILENFTKTIEFPAHKNLCAPIKIPPCPECKATPPVHRNGCRTGVMADVGERLLAKVTLADEKREALGEHYAPPTTDEIQIKRSRVVSSQCFVQAIEALLALLKHGECPVEWAGGFCECGDFVPTKDQVALGEQAMLKLAEIGLVLSQQVHYPDLPFGQSLPVMYYLQRNYMEENCVSNQSLVNQDHDRSSR